MPISAKVKLNLNFPELMLQEQLKDIADKIIIPDIVGRMNSGIDISGRGYNGLAQSTLIQKQKKGLRPEVLLASGQLRRSVKSEYSGRNAVKITPSGSRYATRTGERTMTNSQLGDILQNQGVRTKHGKRYFEFFGISDKAENKAISFMSEYIREAIQRGGRKLIR